MERRDFIKIAGGTFLAGSAIAYACRFLTASNLDGLIVENLMTGKKYGMVIDLTKCIPGCTACIEACRTENNVTYVNDERWDIHWLRKVTIENKLTPEVGRKEVLLLCNHCDKPPCAQVCPVQATYKRHDGIVIVDHHRCIGCRYCVIACPYNARMFNFKDSEEWPNTDHPKRSHGVAEACTLCAHRLDVGRMPACVEACQKVGAGAIVVGDLNDPDSEISEIVARRAVKRIKEDLGTEPKVHYIGL
ncbi:MAG: 4Fe-4S dicluster domain-containing protein [candidate division Zixibacteria bacterium]|nr:4Fe-4S dicluster domain-containing protein [candidate division Zixibacteria bacterium]NIR67856.1 4Fe-4S dicluster domain-containing protein [candidate division Zixibacteria bacterium]NIS15552.1 4Fe-4S dicluster domain-containing protein [candidate division Zixibacteria bacterium]NIS49082.1 4Fe-4S dicluster domain-containing protein [candidate division Zixibacteria bacterium]NIT52077.1 4Fe-4S dicluster domain-containing protein [candidate division Zixibacteria bacterium]